jgi:hypothetical protein
MQSLTALEADQELFQLNQRLLRVQLSLLVAALDFQDLDLHLQAGVAIAVQQSLLELP